MQVHTVFALCLIALALVAGAYAADPKRPLVSETFYADVDVTTTVPGGVTAKGKGYWTADQYKGWNSEYVTFPKEWSFLISHHVWRYDLHHAYEVAGNNTCVSLPLEGQMPMLWSWLLLAQYDGEKKIDGHTYHTWGFKLGYSEVGVAVTSDHPDVPVYFFTRTAVANFTAKFSNWSTKSPDSRWFSVPKQCHNQESVTVVPETQANAPGCVSRATMISRATVWVNNRVPYNQGGRYQGYREDCSGYVSMAWETSQPGYVTSTLPQIAHPISKGELQPGDVLLCAAEHVVLFGGWTDGAQTHYTAFEETRPGEGTVKRVTPYPYWYNTGCFKPYRYNGVC
eukprot:TRINITY_DN1781_c0_g1_i1.p1 TRINITY_DN1781_c0_g1~~TRINITY_DN1781_c0_g1_i1.p1  ORF type:complete len:340 (+),score=36.35 TRINITY_DN1781_c0_g1_i1:32-1051(+)